MTPNAKKSEGGPWFCTKITSGAIYPGVPLVSLELSFSLILATPKSVIRKYPFFSRTKFSGFISR